MSFKEYNSRSHYKRLYVALDGRFALNNGRPASYNMDREFFSRYADTFEEVVVVARLFKVEETATKPIECTHDNISFKALPSYRGPAQFALAFPIILWRLIQIVMDRDAISMVRLPTTIGGLLGLLLAIVRRPYGVELVGDPAAAYSSESLRHPAAPFFKWAFTASTRFLCRHSKTVSYVTRETLQVDYPPGRHADTFHYTSLDLPKEFLSSSPRPVERFQRAEFNLVQVAMMPTYYKGHDISIATLKRLIDLGQNVRLTLVGDGDKRPNFEALAVELGVWDYVDFVGQFLTGPEVLRALDEADVLILPSRQEGLPRVVIEAMARGVPCVAHNIGGTAELLDDSQLVDVLTAENFAAKIAKNIADPELLAQQSARNLNLAGDYVQSRVQTRRNECYQALSCA